MRILILCTGNSCRSQMAHGILQAAHPEHEIHSAGTSPAERVNHRLHIGFEDPSEALGDETFLLNEFRRIRDQINNKLTDWPIAPPA